MSRSSIPLGLYRGEDNCLTRVKWLTRVKVYSVTGVITRVPNYYLPIMT